MPTTDPNDIVGIPHKVNWQEAQQRCKSMGRPLLKLTNQKHVELSKDIISKQLRYDFESVIFPLILSNVKHCRTTMWLDDFHDKKAL